MVSPQQARNPVVSERDTDTTTPPPVAERPGRDTTPSPSGDTDRQLTVEVKLYVDVVASDVRDQGLVVRVSSLFGVWAWRSRMFNGRGFARGVLNTVTSLLSSRVC